MKKYLLAAVFWRLALAPALAQPTTTPQVRPVAAFHAISVGSGIELQLTAGATQRVEASAVTTDVRDHLLTTVVGGVLQIHYDNPDELGQHSRVNRQLRVAVTADHLTALTAGSGAVVAATGNFAAADLQLDVSSGASLKASDLAPGVLVVRQSSGSSVALSGRAPRFDLRAGSGATFNGENLQTDRSQVEASSGSSVRLAVKDDLLAEAASGASIRYIGSPEVTKHVGSGGSVAEAKRK